MKSSVRIAVMLVLPMASIAWAHPGHAHHGMTAGALHPLTGLDHMLAMIAVGLWAVQIGGIAIWRLPLTFVGVMAAGGGLARLGVPMPAVESTIAASVLVLGLALAVWSKPPALAASALVGLFALFHGYAHMAEIGAGQNSTAYAMGFVIATLMLHGVGIAIGLAAKQSVGIAAIRWAGIAIALCGVWIGVAAVA